MTTSRAELLERLERESFDIAIVGGGITGAGIARDAAMRGLSVALVEKGDFASGTSSRSSRLIHGGLRYLRHRQIGLVREALRERGMLLRLAPHLVRPIPFVLPVYRDSRDAPLLLRLGLAGYDALAGTLGIGWHRAFSAEQTVRAEPSLRPEGLRAGFRYFDAVTNDARLTITVVVSALRLGAAAVNYVEAVGFEKSGGRVAGVQYRDLVSGKEGLLRAKVVVSAAGPWTDQVRALAGRPPLLRPTKGIHIVVPRARLPVNSAVAFGEGERIIFAVPHGVHTYIGTTDTDFEGDAGAAWADADDVRYLLDAANATFTTGLVPEDVVATWAGVRPLLKGEGSPSDVSRDYEIVDGPPGLYTICGGKLTTFRSMAEHLLDHVIERDGDQFSQRPGRCRTAREPLPGGATGDFPRYRKALLRALGEAWGIPEASADRLLSAFGAEHVRVLALAARRPELLEPLAGGPALLAEAVYAVREEMAVTLEDVLHRRLDLMLFGPGDHPALASQTARIVAGELAWSPQEGERQVAAYLDAAGRMLAFRSSLGAAPTETGA
jgi:glycerol-3-phosphate dehydrogenase